MSTRCTIHFHYGSKEDEHEAGAIVYRHSDGYPDSEHGVPASLERFFADVQKQTSDTRFGDPSYLAAKFVVWQAGQYSEPGSLNFLSVGVLLVDPGDIEYRYHVWCTGRNVPEVTWKKVPFRL